MFWSAPIGWMCVSCSAWFLFVLCCCAGPSLSHWGGLVVVCLGLMLPALHSAAAGPRGGWTPALLQSHTLAHMHTRTHAHLQGLLFIQCTSSAQLLSAAITPHVLVSGLDHCVVMLFFFYHFLSLYRWHHWTNVLIHLIQPFCHSAILLAAIVCCCYQCTQTGELSLSGCWSV